MTSKTEFAAKFDTILAEVTAAGRASRWARAAKHKRVYMYGLVTPKTFVDVRAAPDDPAATWQVLRELCRHLRFCRTDLASHAHCLRVKVVADGEVHVLHEQWRDRRLVMGSGELFREISESMGAE